LVAEAVFSGGDVVLKAVMSRDGFQAARTPTILIADDHPLILAGVQALLSSAAFEVVGTALDGQDALNLVHVLNPDVIILDLAMPRRGGMEVLRSLRARNDMRAVVLLTAWISDSDLVEAIDLKVQGIVPKEGAEALLVACLNDVVTGGQWIERSILQRALSIARVGADDPRSSLTKRERAIAQLVARGLKNRDIAGELCVTEGTIKLMIHRIFAKLQVTNRVELALLMERTA
jgi:two-component system, NarL family, nitrate/nitrite response regulator NarL